MSIDKESRNPAICPEQEQGALANPDQVYVDWILQALAKEPKLNKSGLAKALGVDAAAVTRMLTGRRRPKLHEIPKIEAYLGSKAPHRASDAPRSAETNLAPTNLLKHVPVRGETAGGRWLEYDLGDREYDDVPVVPTRYPQLEQFAYRVSGNSMEKARIHDGDYVVCVPYFLARSTISHGDIVVVERRRGGLYERTCKEVEVEGATVSLRSRSDDPRHAERVFVSNGEAPEEGVEVEVVGLVIGRYSPI